MDDLIHFSNDVKELKKVKDVLSAKYKIKDLRKTKEFLGLRITRDWKAATTILVLIKKNLLNKC